MSGSDEKRIPRVLLTGATGRIGRHVLAELTANAFVVRAVTSQGLSSAQKADSAVEWRNHDFMQSLDMDALVQGCDAVLHLAGEVWNIPRMERLNVEATRALAEAAGRQGVRYFGFTSSIAVYGSAKSVRVDETSPLLTADRDIPGEYRGNASIRAYGRSKVRAEQALAALSPPLECEIFRPTVVVDRPAIVALAQRGRGMRFVLGARHEHLIYVGDVAHAMVWALSRALERKVASPGIEIYNLSDDSSPDVTGKAILSRAWALTGDPRYRPSVSGPLWLYNLFDMLKNRSVSLRHPLGGMVFLPDKLLGQGYRYKYGVEEALRLAFEPEGVI